MTSASAFDPKFEPEEDYPDGYRGRWAPVGRQAGAEHLGASLYEVDPGQVLCPYHWHAGNEEMLIVLRGAPTLRTPAGRRPLVEGEVVVFPAGEGGAHTVINTTGDPIRVLMISEMNGPDVIVYPDSDKVLARQLASGSPAEGIRALFRLTDQVDYWEGELPPHDAETR
jgi:uncharacterized cupin superfamily protein